MPLILITGLPCSGKSYRAAQIATEFQNRIASHPEVNARRSVIHLHSNHARFDDALSIELEISVADTQNERGMIGIPKEKDLRNTIYNTANLEKNARAEEFSAVKRALSKDTVVIADGLNYIKGFRYQLWCEAKAVGTRSVVVHVAARDGTCEEWNTGRIRAWGWGSEGEDKEGVLGTSMGVLVPESHTDIYGDRGGQEHASSRRSSIDGGNEGVERRKLQKDDGMTLKSLYLLDDKHNDGSTDPEQSNGRSAPAPTTATTNPPNSHSVSIPPPPPSHSPPYKYSTLASLIMRYEPPSPFSRWDTPLFTVPPSDPTPPFDAIWDAVFPQPVKSMSKKAIAQRQSEGVNNNEKEKAEAVKQHAATILPKATDADALQTLEGATGDVVREILAAARKLGMADTGEGRTVLFSVPTHPTSSASTHTSTQKSIELELTVPPGTILSQPMLQRLRRKYTGMQRGGIAHGVGHVGGGRKGAIEGFVRFLGAEWES